MHQRHSTGRLPANRKEVFFVSSSFIVTSFGGPGE